MNTFFSKTIFSIRQNAVRRSFIHLAIGAALWRLITSDGRKVVDTAIVLKNGWVVKKSEIRD